MKNKGIWLGIGAYACWGVLPIFWKAIQDVPAVQIVAHRLAWSLVFLTIVLTLRSGWSGMLSALNRRNLMIYSAAAVLLTLNWLVYIWGVNAGFIVETSLGYFINPLVSVLLGVIFMRERLSPAKWIPVGLAAIGVIYLTISYGSLPWISLALAFTFGLYGLFKKLSPLGSLNGLTLETGVLFVPAVLYLVYLETQGTGAFGHIPFWQNVLLALSGVVTAVPLLLFAGAARSIPLSTVGLLQYIAPTLQFILGVFVYNEPFTLEKLVGYAIIWLALLIFSVGGVYERNRYLVAGRQHAVHSK